MRRTATPAITAQMYRHFATLTVACTALVAVFANGEKQQAVAAETAASRPHETRLKSHPKSKPTPVNEGSEDTGIWGDDETEGFGHPTVRVSASESWFSSTFGSASDRHIGRGDNPTLQDSEDVDETPSLHGAAADPAVPTAAEIAAAAAASRQRSGASGSD
ncbi:MAG: hypothetical protein ACXU61_06705 [Croceibacterium sp.]